MEVVREDWGYGRLILSSPNPIITLQGQIDHYIGAFSPTSQLSPAFCLCTPLTVRTMIMTNDLEACKSQT